MYPSIWHRQINIHKNERIVIIGAGLAGLSLAYWLAKLGIKTLVLESSFVGDGASGRNAGFLTGGSLSYFNTLIKKYGEKLALEKWSYTASNIELLMSELSFSEKVKVGTTTLFSKKDEEIQQAYQKLKDFGFKVKEVASPIKKFTSAYHFEAEGFHDPMKTLMILKEKIKDHSEILEGVNVTKIHSDMLETNIGNISYSKVFVATNSRLNELCKTQKIIPKRAQILYGEGNFSLGDANISIPSERIYLRSHQKGLLIGGLRLLDEKNENTQELALNHKIQIALETWVHTNLSQIEVKQRWAGIMGFTDDELPISGRIEGTNQFYLGGFSGHGNGYAFKMAKDLIDKWMK